MSPAEWLGIMTVGHVLAALKRLDHDGNIQFDFGGFYPYGLNSYRGYYEDLSIGYGRDPMTVKQFEALLLGAIGRNFVGYKGGEYEMGKSTFIWVDDHSSANGVGLVGIENHKHWASITTKLVDP